MGWEDERKKGIVEERNPNSKMGLVTEFKFEILLGKVFEKR